MAKDQSVELMKKTVRYFEGLNELLASATQESERTFIRERAAALAASAATTPKPE